MSAARSARRRARRSICASQARRRCRSATASSPSRGAALQGALNLDIAVAGTASAPKFSGRVTSEGGGFVDPDTRHRAPQPRARRDALRRPHRRRAAQRAKRRRERSRRWARSASTRMPAFRSSSPCRCSKARYVDGTLVAARFDADLKLTGTLSAGPLLEGAVFLDRTEVTVPERLPRDSRRGRRDACRPVADRSRRRLPRRAGSDARAGTAAAASPPASGSMSRSMRRSGFLCAAGGSIPSSAAICGSSARSRRSSAVRRVHDGARPARHPDAADHLRPRHRHLRRRSRSDPRIFRLDAERRHRPSPSRSPAAPPIRR